MSSKIKTYSELMQYETLVDRFRYLALRGRVGETTFGFDRWMNQQFYASREWKLARQHVIIRDEGRDLGIEGYEIHTGLTIHHLNPMMVADIREGGPEILDPEFLITTTLPTHNAIHYGDERFLPGVLVERKRGDTKLW
jgi:hypothetical protein